MKIYTKTGDKGETSLFGGKRVPKYYDRINAYGTVDELLSYIGLLRDQEVFNDEEAMLVEIQDRLFTLGAILAADPDKPKLKKPDLHESDIELLEKEIDRMSEELPGLKQFILPGGHQSVSFTHIARTVCRRAERLTIAIGDDFLHETLVIKYLNRLSDYLFELARYASKKLDAPETPWTPRM